MKINRILLDPAPNLGGTLTEDPPSGLQDSQPAAPSGEIINLDDVANDIEVFDDKPAPGDPVPEARRDTTTKPQASKPQASKQVEKSTETPNEEPAAPDEDPLLPKSLFKAPAPKPGEKEYIPTDAEKTEFAARDYSGFSDEHKAFLKTQPNRVFAFAKKILPELYAAQAKEKELTTKAEELTRKASGAMPESYYENPEAYKLAPEYKQLSQAYDTATFESNYCQQTLLAIENGEDITPFQGYQANGQPVFGQPRKATAQDKIQLQTALSQSEQNKQAILAQSGQLQAAFKQRHEAAIAGLNAFAAEASKILPDQFRPDRKEVAAFLDKKIAPERRHLPEAKLAAAMWSTLLKQARFINQLQTAKQTEVVAAATAKAAGPARRPIAAAPATRPTGKTINFDELREEMEAVGT